MINDRTKDTLTIVIFYLIVKLLFFLENEHQLVIGFHFPEEKVCNLNVYF